MPGGATKQRCSLQNFKLGKAKIAIFPAFISLVNIVLQKKEGSLSSSFGFLCYLCRARVQIRYIFFVIKAMSAEVNEVLRGLNGKFEQLISLYEKARVERDKAQDDRVHLEVRRQEQEKKMAELESKNKSLLVTQAFTAANGGAQEAKEKIGKIVREIDKCITLLSK